MRGPGRDPVRRYHPWMDGAGADGTEATRPAVAMLRPALELAWWVAKLGSRSRPPIPVPARLRPIMRVTRLPDRMLETIREVVDTDAEFRQRVAKAATDESALGRPSWLWLVRPEGWESELAVLVEEAAGADLEERKKREAESAVKQLAEATAALQRAQAELVALKLANDDLRASAARRSKDDRLHHEGVRTLSAELEAARAEIDRVRSLNDELSSTLESRSKELSDASGRRREDQRLIEDLRAQLEAAHRLADDARNAVHRIDADATRLREGLARAEAGARALAEDIAGAAGRAATTTAGGEPPAATGVVTEARTRAEPQRTRRRVPLALPPATFEDSPEAAAHLVRAEGVLLAVDGYNVTLRSWPSLALAEQRRRLVDSLAELVMRAGTEVLLVFDGTDSGNRLGPPAAVRGRLRVVFSPSEVEADDVIIAAVDAFPPERPVVVATNDRRVRDSTSALGANVISVDQLLSVLGRGSRG